MEDHSTPFKIEQAKISLSKGGETSVAYGLPEKTRQPTTCIIIAHGAGGPMYSPFIRFFHTELAKRGFLTVRFNFPYMEARRKIPDRREILEQSYRDIIDETAKGKLKPRRMIIGGKSMGGRIASQVAASNDQLVDALFFLGYPLHPLGKIEQLRDEHLYKIKKPMLFLSGTRDGFAKRELLDKVLVKIGPTARVQWIENGDHSFKIPDAKTGDPDGAHQALSALVEWLDSLPLESTT